MAKRKADPPPPVPGPVLDSSIFDPDTFEPDPLQAIQEMLKAAEEELASTGTRTLDPPAPLPAAPLPRGLTLPPPHPAEGLAPVLTTIPIYRDATAPPDAVPVHVRFERAAEVPLQPYDPEGDYRRMLAERSPRGTSGVGRGGRLPPDHVRSATMALPATYAEREAYHAAARQEGMMFSEWARGLLLARVEWLENKRKGRS